MYEFAVTPAVTQLRRPGVTITEVEPGTVGDEIGLRPGDRIVKVNRRPVRDYLDFRFQTAGETELTFQVKKPNGETLEFEFDRDESDGLGLMFEQIVPRQCANECIFCFCKGNPADARPSLFVRDEDIRLSFLYGNYTTLTSITDDEMDRVIEQRLSPQYVSVHATDLKTRAYLLGVDERRADISEKLARLLKNDIEIHAQVVLCPGINDGPILEKTVRDLADHFPKVLSTAIVPVALTRYNTDERLSRVTPEFCRKTIKDIEPLQRDFRRGLGTTFAFLGDEIYLKGGVPIPSKRHYGSYPQIEDGVGMVRSFVERFERLFERPSPMARRAEGVALARQYFANARTHPTARLPKTNAISARQVKPPAFGSARKLNGTILTGEMFAPVLVDLVGRFNSEFGSRLRVVAVENDYFGGDVAVAGLLAGSDLMRAKGSVKGDFAMVPPAVIKSDEPILIDGMRFETLRSEFPVPIVAEDLIEFLAERI